MSAAASSSAPDMDVVGLVFKGTLQNGEQVQGTVFTFNQVEEVLVLMLHPIRNDHPSFKMINLNFVTEYTLEKSGKEFLLPRHLDAGQTLPTMIGDRGELPKSTARELKTAETRRHAMISGLNKAPLVAVETYLSLVRVFPTCQWENNCIMVTKEVLVQGEPDWQTPVVKCVSGTSDPETAERIKKHLLSLRQN